MSTDKTILTIDAGNTSVKVGIFLNNELKVVKRFTLEDIQTLIYFLKSQDYSQAIVASVLSKIDTKKITSLLKSHILLDVNTPVPLKLMYKTPKTLGIDRICNATGIKPQIRTEYAVCIDIGTCIKFDLISNKNEYLGGSISPGIDLRYKSLNDYTGNLPLISNKTSTNLVGEDTKTSIQSGIINGINAEINGLMLEYSKKYSDLTFFVTGGDATFFDLHSKNDIFANENLTLLGLFEIYRHNAK